MELVRQPIKLLDDLFKFIKVLAMSETELLSQLFLVRVAVS
jgi:hypothetical protein